MCYPLTFAIYTCENSVGLFMIHHSHLHLFYNKNISMLSQIAFSVVIFPIFLKFIDPFDWRIGKICPDLREYLLNLADLKHLIKLCGSTGFSLTYIIFINGFMANHHTGHFGTHCCHVCCHRRD